MSSFPLLLIRTIETGADFYQMAILARIVITWIRMDENNQFIIVLKAIVDPYLEYVRKIFPLTIGMFDFSPILAFILIDIAKMILVKSIIILLGG